MLKLVHSQSKPTEAGPAEEDRNDKLPSKETAISQPVAPHLRLIVSNSSPLPAPVKPFPGIRNPDATAPFTAKVRLRGPWLYEMAVRDPSHYLKCDLTLEVEEAINEIEPGRVVCHFPAILDKQLSAFVEEDETLHGMIMIQFQMKVMEQLLLFCGDYSVSHLVIYTDDEQAEELGIYQDFLVHQDQTLTSQGEKTEMVIPTDTETFDDWIGFMEEVKLKFAQELWREQRHNHVIREYLKFHPLN